MLTPPCDNPCISPISPDACLAANGRFFSLGLTGSIGRDRDAGSLEMSANGALCTAAWVEVASPPIPRIPG